MTIPQSVSDCLDRLAPLPAPARRLLQGLCRDEDDLRAEVSGAIQADSDLATRILTIFNSPFYSGRYPMERLDEAIERFGLSALVDILLTDHVLASGWDAPLYGLSASDFWLHAAVASQAVIETIRENPRKEIPRAASVAALLHDVGKVAVSRSVQGSPAELLALAHSENLTFIEAERRRFGTDHTELGGEMARRWSLPQFLTEAIEGHHRVPLPDPTAVIDAVALANLVAKTIGVGLGSEGLNFGMDPGCYTRLGLDFNGFCRVCARTAMSLPDLKAAYGV